MSEYDKTNCGPIITCSKRNKFFKTKTNISKTKRITICTCVILVILFLSSFIFGLIVVNPVIKKVSASSVTKQTRAAVSSAILNCISDDVTYSKLITVQKNTLGDITMLQVNSVNVNIIVRKIVEKTAVSLESVAKDGIDIPIGYFTGIPLLAGKGTSINFSMLPIGDVECLFKSEFDTAGINQTRHRIYADIVVDMNVIIPTLSHTVKTSTTMLLAEGLIVGKIPSTYLNSNRLDESLNLVPH